MKIPNIGVVLNWRNQVNKSGLYHVYLRIQIGETSRYHKIETLQKIRNIDWSGNDDGWLKDTHPFYFEINNTVREKKSIVYDLIKRNYNLNTSLTFETILSHLKKKGYINSFYDFGRLQVNLLLNCPYEFEEDFGLQYCCFGAYNFAKRVMKAAGFVQII